MKPFAVGLLTFVALDLVWIGVVANAFYRRELAALTQIGHSAFVVRLGPVLVLYPLLVAGLQLFALPKASGRGGAAAAWGGLFGVIAYGVYDLTNYATVPDYTLRMTVVDMSWGLVISAVTAAAMARASR